MATLAIRGHATRESEVIGLLEMLGGKNFYNEDMGRIDMVFYISDDKRIRALGYEYSKKTNATIFTLEEFLEKFPYKVGDKVIYNDNPMTITKMVWEEQTNTIAYKLDDKLYCNVMEELQPYTEQKEETMEETINNLVEDIIYHSKIVWNDKFPDKTEIVLGEDFEAFVENGHYYIARKQPQYPKTYEECCEVLGINELPYMVYTWNRNEDVEAVLQEHQTTLLMKLEEFRKLLICRDSYWKVAGDWKPDWKDCTKPKYTIHLHCDGHIFWQDISHTEYRWLSFHTTEMRDAFYGNFKELIEECKELL